MPEKIDPERPTPSVLFIQILNIVPYLAKRVLCDDTSKGVPKNIDELPAIIDGKKPKQGSSVIINL